MSLIVSQAGLKVSHLRVNDVADALTKATTSRCVINCDIQARVTGIPADAGNKSDEGEGSKRR